MWVKKIAKNTIGVSLVVMGCVMLVIPGPGLLTLLTGLYITDFPGKASLVAKMRKSKFYHRYLGNIESRLRSGETKVRSMLKRKNR